MSEELVVRDNQIALSTFNALLFAFLTVLKLVLGENPGEAAIPGFLAAIFAMQARSSRGRTVLRLDDQGVTFEAFLPRSIAIRESLAPTVPWSKMAGCSSRRNAFHFQLDSGKTIPVSTWHMFPTDLRKLRKLLADRFPPAHAGAT